jgi:hypothetical protein
MHQNLKYINSKIITGIVPGKAASMTDTFVLTGSLKDVDDSNFFIKFKIFVK